MTEIRHDFRVYVTAAAVPGAARGPADGSSTLRT